MTIKELEKKYDLDPNTIAYFFDLTYMSYMNSTARDRYKESVCRILEHVILHNLNITVKNLKKLNKSSILIFGQFKGNSIKDLLDSGKHVDLASYYYNIESVNYEESVLKELNIKEDLLIEKPGISKKKYYEYLKEKGYYLNR